MKIHKTIFIVLLFLIITGSSNLNAQRIMTLQECRELALENNNDLKIAGEKITMADYEKKQHSPIIFQNSQLQVFICITAKTLP